MESLAAYIPMDRRQAMLRGQDLPDRTRGAVLFADISGFTPLTDVLAATLGRKQGADELTRQLNLVYEALITEVHRYGGSVVSFSGDAITCWFTAGPSGEAELRATACAWAMQQALKHFARVQIPSGETFSLAIKVSVAGGGARRFRVGDPGIQYVDVLAGATLDRMAAGEKQAGQGEVVLGAEVIAQLGGQVEVTDWRTDAGTGWRFGLVDSLAGPVQAAPWPAQGESLAEDRIRPWLLPAVYERLRVGQGRYLAELRTAVALFLRFGGLDYDGDDLVGDKLDAYIRWVQNVLARHEGYLIQVTTGDKGSYLYAAFGAPVTRGDDAARAVAAALELRSPAPELDFISSTQIGLSQGQMRAGAYGSPARRTYGVLGSEVNIAARLMAKTQPGQILVSKRVADAAGKSYHFEALNAIEVKGRQGAMPVFGVSDRRPGFHRLDLGGGSEPIAYGRRDQVEAVPSPKTTMVGRGAERKVLADHLRALLDDRAGGLVVIEGEAGIGKSRLAADLIDQAQALDVTCLIGAGDVIEESTPYYAWRHVFSHLLYQDGAPGDEHVPARLAADPELTRLAPLLKAVLPLDLPDNEITAQMTGQVRADNTRELLARLLQRSVARSPTLLVLEDAHWLDSASWALAGLVSRRVQPLLLVVTTRTLAGPPPAEYSQLLQNPGARHLRLDTLSPEDVLTLVSQRLGVDTLSGPVADLIRRKAEGHPFFSEELAYALRDKGLIQIVDGGCRMASDVGDISTVSLPDTVEEVITSRIDRLTPDQKLTLKVASVIGRVFPLSTLRDVHPGENGLQLAGQLEATGRLDITLLEKPEPDLAYIFKHMITHEVVYSLLPLAQRQPLHQAVADCLERMHADDLAPFSQLLAYHYERAGNISAAVTHLTRAGERAVQVGAYQDALSQLGHALELVGTQPQTPESIQQEIDILVVLGSAQIATQGQGSPEVRRTYDRALALCQLVGEIPQLAQVLFGLSVISFFQGELYAGRTLAEQCLRLAEKMQDSALRLQAHLMLGNCSFWLGDFVQTLYHSEQIIAAYDSSRGQTTHIASYAQNPRITCLTGSTWATCIMGYPERAQARSQEALALAEKLGHPYNLAIAIQIEAWLRQHRREYKETQAQADKLIALTERSGFPIYRILGTILRGWALAHQGQAAEGVAQIEAAMATWQATGSRLGWTFFTVMLAEAYLQAGLIEKGSALVAGVLEDDRGSEEVNYRAELLRLKGEFLLAGARENPIAVSTAQGAGHAFDQALEVARSQGARLFELRASMSWCRLARRLEESGEARAQLETVYLGFTEGWATQDLQGAAAMLYELEHAEQQGMRGALPIK